MKTASAILEYIDLYYARVISRPYMYAASPESLQDIIFALEFLRDEILEDSSRSSTFSDFLLDQGFESGVIVRRNDAPELSFEQFQLHFRPVTSQLEEFLRRHSRLRPPED